MDSLDMLANNLANASAPGFKADREFYSTYAAADVSEAPESVMPVVERRWTDYSQGAIETTGNPLDLALSGKGFFVAVSPSGPLLTRDGSFRLSSAGTLVTQDGFSVRGQDGKPIQIDASKTVEVTSRGEIKQDGQTVSQLDIVDVPNESSLGKHGLNYFEFAPTAVARMTTQEIRQGALESGNVQTADSSVRLISVMRQFEMLQRAANVGSDMGRRALEEVAKVNG